MLNYALNAKRSSTIKHKVNKIYTIKVMQNPKEINDYSPLFIDGHIVESPGNKNCLKTCLKQFTEVDNMLIE